MSKLSLSCILDIKRFISYYSISLTYQVIGWKYCVEVMVVFFGYVCYRQYSCWKIKQVPCQPCTSRSRNFLKKSIFLKMFYNLGETSFNSSYPAQFVVSLYVYDFFLYLPFWVRGLMTLVVSTNQCPHHSLCLDTFESICFSPPLRQISWHRCQNQLF